MVAAKKRILFIASEMSPYLEETDFSSIVNQLAIKANDGGFEIRCIMPRFGVINERRNRLHEVVRLSGINISIDDKDNPLMIKVASISEARMQVYFLDNEDFFHRKHVFTDAKGKFYPDNDDRAIFFCKGALETVKKLGWAPDVVHCHGWMSSLVPAYLKTSYKDDPTFKDAKIVYSIYNTSFTSSLGANFAQKALIKGMETKDTINYAEGTHQTMNKAAIAYSDAIVIGDDSVDEDVLNFVKKSEKPVLAYDSTLDLDNYYNFYQEIASDELISVA